MTVASNFSIETLGTGFPRHRAGAPTPTALETGSSRKATPGRPTGYRRVWGGIIAGVDTPAKILTPSGVLSIRPCDSRAIHAAVSDPKDILNDKQETTYVSWATSTSAWQVLSTSSK